MMVSSQRDDDFGAEFFRLLASDRGQFYQRFGRKAITSMPLQRTLFEGLTPLRAAYSGPAASDHPPQPFEDLRDHVAEQQQCRRPYQRRHEIRDLKAPVGHLEYPGSERHRGA